MKQFIALALLLGFTTAPAYARPYVAPTDWELRLETRTDVYVLDHGMTLTDCGERAVQVQRLIRHMPGELVCVRNIQPR